MTTAVTPFVTRRLNRKHSPYIEAHLLSLSGYDRQMRFGNRLANSAIRDYLKHVDFDSDIVLGMFDDEKSLIGFSHLAIRPCNAEGETPTQTQLTNGELGLSVVDGHKGRGYGTQLFDQTIEHAQKKGVSTVIIHSFLGNVPMLKLARKAGAQIERTLSEAQAIIRLPRGKASEAGVASGTSPAC